jgi:hypothetical protein
MTERSSGRIVFEIPQETKERLFDHCRGKGISLRDWFIGQAEQLLGRSTGLTLPSQKYSAFISHAHEDKELFVRPLAQALDRLGLAIWYDEFELQVGDSLRRSIDQGLRASRYGIVVFSQAFFRKNWPQYELNGLLAREIAGNKVILPVWHGVSHEDVMHYSPSMVDKIALNSASMSIDAIAQALSVVIGTDGHPEP